MNVFHTINAPSHELYKEKGSKFLAFAFPVSSESEVSFHLQELRKKYHDARHFCFAYIIGLKQQQYRANDDGEPNHSAGDPILGQIRSHELTNTLVVVVRYFGGTKLGVGGLISAYKTAANLAISEAEVKIIYSRTKFILSFEYHETASVERILGGFDIDYQSKGYNQNCEYIGQILDEKYEILEEKFSLLNAKILLLNEE